MKLKAINGRWMIWTTNAIAEWDGLSGDPTLDSGWEACRFRSMQRELKYGDIFFDVGTEHGAISTVIAREFVGAENMVLFEPSPEFWPNIEKHWRHNGLNHPLGCWSGFVADTSDPGVSVLASRVWPDGATADVPEVPGMAYRYLNDSRGIPKISLDDYIDRSGIHPTAVNIDVEGAELLVLKGLQQELGNRYSNLSLVWVSIHPDLMERDFNDTKQELLDYMAARGTGWNATHLGTDHEEHFLFERVPF